MRGVPGVTLLLVLAGAATLPAWAGGTAAADTSGGADRSESAESRPLPHDPAGLLVAARQALLAQQDQRAGSALEHAERQLLDRPLPIGEKTKPVSSPLVQAIASARAKLVDGDRRGALAGVNDAIARLPPGAPAP